MKRAPAVAAAATALVIAGCGGDDSLSEDEYASQLNEACTALADEIRDLPQRAADENLDPAQAQQIAEDAGDEFTAEVEELEPPEDLSDTHDDLVELAGENPQSDSLEEAIETNQRYAAIFDDLGAEECADLQREGAEQLEQNAEQVQQRVDEVQKELDQLQPTNPGSP